MKKKHFGCLLLTNHFCFETTNQTLTKIRYMYFLQAVVSVLVIFALQGFAVGEQSELFLHFDRYVQGGGCD